MRDSWRPRSGNEPDNAQTPAYHSNQSYITTTTTQVLLHGFNGLFSRTTWVSQYQKGIINSLDLNEARDDRGFGMAVASAGPSAPRSRQITTPTPHHSIFSVRMLFLILTPNQQCQSTEGKQSYIPKIKSDDNKTPFRITQAKISRL